MQQKKEKKELRKKAEMEKRKAEQLRIAREEKKNQIIKNESSVDKKIKNVKKSKFEEEKQRILDEKKRKLLPLGDEKVTQITVINKSDLEKEAEEFKISDSHASIKKDVQMIKKSRRKNIKKRLQKFDLMKLTKDVIATLMKKKRK